jgi:putative sigma-54 modulation protein
VTTKLDRITRHFDQVVDVKVLLTVEKQKEKERRQRAECNIHVKGSDMFAESSHEDLYAAVDDLVDKLDRQVVRHKDRLQDHHHPGGQAPDVRPPHRDMDQFKQPPGGFSGFFWGTCARGRFTPCCSAHAPLRCIIGHPP